MGEKWEIRELASNEFPETQLRYAVYDESYETVSVHFWEEDARQMAAVPLLNSALRKAYDYIIEVSRQFCIVPEADVTERIVAAIAAAEGE
jgi:hypothetical protein